MLGAPAVPLGGEHAGGDAAGVPNRSVSWTPGLPLDVISTCKFSLNVWLME